MGKKLKENKPKRAVKKTAPKNKKTKDEQGDKFNFNDEIVIGIPMPVNEKKIPKKKQKNKSSKPKNKSTYKNLNVEPKKKKNSKIAMVAKAFVIILIIAAGTVFLLVSPEFNIDNINVNGNSHLDAQTIINLSNIQISENIFSYSRRKAMSGIKQNPYVENVYIKRKFPNTVDIIVKERETAFNISNENEYIYINNKGYILEISNTKAEKPVLVGISTAKEDLKEGKRLAKGDLEKLNDITKILDICSNNDLSNLITSIDVTKSNEYSITMESEGKIIHIGDISNLITKILYAKDIIEKEKGISGEIFVNMDLNNENAFFREKV